MLLVVRSLIIVAMCVVAAWDWVGVVIIALAVSR